MRSPLARPTHAPAPPVGGADGGTAPAAAAPLAWGLGLVAAWVAFGWSGLLGGLVAWALDLLARPRPRTTAALAALLLAVAGLTWLAGGVPDLGGVHGIVRRDAASTFAVVGLVLLASAALRTAPDRGPAGGDGSPVPEHHEERDLTAPVADARALLASAVARVVAPGRAPEVAFARAVAIVVVVAIHALPAEFALGRSDLDRWLGDVTRFAVPTFFVVTGHLAARRGTPRGWTSHRLARLVPPWLVASAVALVLGRWSTAFPVVERPVRALLLGAVQGPHYFVFVLVLVTPLVPLLVRLRGRWLAMALALAVAAQVAVTGLDRSLFWEVRDPLTWVAFLVAGITTWRLHDRLGRWARAWPAVALAWALAAVALVVVPDDTLVRDLVTLLATWLALATLWLAGRERTALPRLAWFLDESSYAVYLHHLPFVLLAVGGPLGATALSVAAPAAVVFGLAGALALVVVGRAVLGPWSRGVLGA